MKITFTPEPIPELILSGGALAALGFTLGTPLQLSVQYPKLWITVVTDEASWKEICSASEYRHDLGADWVRENGDLIVGGQWLTDLGITAASEVDITANTGVICLQRREEKGFRA